MHFPFPRLTCLLPLKWSISHSAVWLFVTLWSIAHCPWNSPGKNTGVGSHSLLQWIFPTQGSNLHCRRILYHLSQQRSPEVPVNGNLFGNKSFASDQVKVIGSHSVWLPLSLTKETLKIDTYGGRRMWGYRKNAIYKSRVIWDYQKLGGAWNRFFPLSPQRGPTLWTPWSWTSSLENCGLWISVV